MQRPELRCEPRLKLELSFKLEQRVCVERPHFALENPSLTIHAAEMEELLEKPLEKILGQSLGPHKRMAQMERYLLDRWKYVSAWQDYLDAPLIAHIDAGLKLRKECDVVVGVQSAGEKYSALFGLLGYPVLDVDYSHHKRDMKEPKIYSVQTDWLRVHGRVLLVDIDFVSGKTLRTVTERLRTDGVTVVGAYIGLTRWPGLGGGVGEIAGTDFREFWGRSRNGLVECEDDQELGRQGVLPNNFIVYGPNKEIGLDSKLGSAAARRIAREFLYR